MLDIPGTCVALGTDEAELVKQSNEQYKKVSGRLHEVIFTLLGSISALPPYKDSKIFYVATLTFQIVTHGMNSNVNCEPSLTT